MKIVWKILKIALIVLLFLIASAIGLSYFFEDEIKAKAIEKIDQSVKADIMVDEIDFSFIRKFPFASLQFQNVNILSENSVNVKDTVLSSDNIFIKISITDLLKKEYNISRIEIDKPNIKLFFFEDGSHNFDIFYESDSTATPLVMLDKISITNGKLLYVNEITNQLLKLNINNTTAKGIFKTEDLKLNVKNDLNIISYVSNNVELLQNKSLITDIGLNYNKKEEIIELKNAKVTYNGLKLSALGDFKILNEAGELNFSLNADNLDINKSLKELPQDNLGRLKNYIIEGKSNISINVNGLINKNTFPDISAAFSVDNGKIKHKEIGRIIENIKLKGNYSNGEKNSLISSEINLENFSFYSDLGESEANVKLTNLINPKISVDLKSAIKLKEINEFNLSQSVSKFDGIADVQLKTNIEIENLHSDKKTDINYKILSGTANLKDVSLKYADNDFTNLNCKLQLDENRLRVYQLQALLNDKETKFNGNIYNVEKLILNPLGKNKIIIHGDLQSENIDADKLLENSGGGVSLISYEAKINMDVKEAKYLELDIRNFKGSLFYNDDLTKVSIQNAEAFNGNIEAEVEYFTGEKDRNLLSIDGKTKGVKIEDVFKFYNDFEQETITHKNLQGNLWSDFSFRMLETKAGKWLTESIKLYSDLEINNGRLKDVDELNALSKFTKIDDFSDIKFSKLSNSISINNSIINIPEMKIQSNKMDIDLYGNHTFSNKYEYHFKVKLSEILAKNVDEKVTEFGRIVDDNTGMYIFLKLIGDSDDFDVSYDGKAARTKLKDDFKQEGKELKEALKKEFSRKKKDKPKTKRDKEKELLKKQEEGKTVIEFDDF